LEPAPIDLHIKGLECWARSMTVETAYVEAKRSVLRGGEIVFDKITVTGTERLDDGRPPWQTAKR